LLIINVGKTDVKQAPVVVFVQRIHLCVHS